MSKITRAHWRFTTDDVLSAYFAGVPVEVCDWMFTELVIVPVFETYFNVVSA